MKTTWRSELPQICLILGMFLVGAICWSRVPSEVPVHWNLAGEVDRMGTKFEGLFVLPIVAAGMYLLFLFIPWIDPRRSNYEKFSKAYGVLRFSILAFMAVIYAAAVAAALGYDNMMQHTVPISVGALLIIVGNYMGKLRPNWFVGVRTPWTLSSKKSWNKTHRLAGWSFVGLGLATLVFGFSGAQWILFSTIALGAALLLWIMIYSYLVWRNDPDRTDPAGTATPDKHSAS